MIQVTDTIAIREEELRFEFIRASGPGGQNVNKVATAVQLRFDVQNAAALPEWVRARLVRLAGKKMARGGVLVITARRFRTQEKNRQDAIDRLVKLIRKATEIPRPRVKTSPTLAAKQQRLQEKRRRSQIKQMRRSDPLSEK
ncbi:MAG: alternative ribosome rescue aminoacyl-tRNA hydrolase ArfB [bacterium]